ncbi:MAG: TraR/DksA C4-type zinc finger protein [Candidatus Aureabacteria bacterium]|nr:TraR/DksA C4-type zinc finger protein [Candidatus Auribacterota bacterium]
MGKKKTVAKKRVKAKQAQKKVRPKKLRSPFSDAVLRKLKELLLSYKERVGGNFMNLRKTHLRSSQRDATGDLSGYTLHMADLASDTYDREFALTVASSEGDIIYLIDRALSRIDEKTFGLCEVCGNPIRMVRLKAVPWATSCIKCQEAEEMGGGES